MVEFVLVLFGFFMVLFINYMVVVWRLFIFFLSGLVNVDSLLLFLLFFRNVLILLKKFMIVWLLLVGSFWLIRFSV